MFRNTLLALLAFVAAAFAQQDASALFENAPADVDRALRARITEFYQYHVTGEFRKAMPLVAEDTQDYFFDTAKPSYISFQITSIKYNKEFTQATAIVTVERAIMLPGFNGQVMKLPTSCTWKLEKDGKWYWWVDPSVRNLSPFSTKPMQAGPKTAGSAPSMADIPLSLEEVNAKVGVDKTALSLKAGGSDTLNIGNSMPGPVMPQVVRKPSGMEVTIADKQIAPGTKTVVTVTAGERPEAGDLVLRIDPLSKIVTVQVVVQK